MFKASRGRGRGRDHGRELTVEDSWRMVEGEHDSFDTTILPGSEDSFRAQHSSGHQSSGFPSQLSSQSFAGLPSQDSIRDFDNSQDDNVILREPFRPSLPHAQRSSDSGFRSPEPQFRMPMMEFDTRSGTSGRSSRTVTGIDRNGNALRRRGNASAPFISPRRQGSRQQRFEEEVDDSNSVSARVFGSLPSVFLWALDLLSMALKLIKRPLAFLLSIYLFFGILIIAQNFITNSITASLSPICRLPGTSMLNLPFCPDASIPTPDGTQHVEFDELMTVQGKFEQVLEQSADGISLPYEMTRSRLALGDLQNLVKHSELKFKDELEYDITQYIGFARDIGFSLSKFNVHVGGAVDFIIHINQWTARFIDTLEHSADESSQSLFASWVGSLFYPFQPVNKVYNEQLLLTKYVEHTTQVSQEISTLLLEAEELLGLLNKGETQLTLIHKITTQASDDTATNRANTLSKIWTKLGGNRANLRNLDQQMNLLDRVDTQRASAIAVVSALVVELQRIQAGLDDLYGRVSVPGALSSTAQVPLSVHVDTINSGIMRLESARRRISAAEDEVVRDALRRGGVKDEPLIEG